MTDQQKKLAAGGAFALVAALILYFELRDPAPPLPAPQVAASAATAGSATTVASTNPAGPAVRVPGGAGAKTTSAQQLDPTLHMGAMLVTESLAYSGTGRNIFSGTSSAPLPTVPKPIRSARPMPTTAPQTFTASVQVGPPPIDLKFFGTETRGAGQRQAFLLRGDDVFLASAGEIVQRRYKVLSIAPSSVVVEDLQNNNRQTLPLSN